MRAAGVLGQHLRHRGEHAESPPCCGAALRKPPVQPSQAVPARSILPLSRSLQPALTRRLHAQPIGRARPPRPRRIVRPRAGRQTVVRPSTQQAQRPRRQYSAPARHSDIGRDQPLQTAAPPPAAGYPRWSLPARQPVCCVVSVHLASSPLRGLFPLVCQQVSILRSSPTHGTMSFSIAHRGARQCRSDQGLARRHERGRQLDILICPPEDSELLRRKTPVDIPARGLRLEYPRRYAAVGRGNSPPWVVRRMNASSIADRGWSPGCTPVVLLDLPLGTQPRRWRCGRAESFTSLRLPNSASHSSKNRMQLEFFSSANAACRFSSMSPMCSLTICEMSILYISMLSWRAHDLRTWSCPCRARPQTGWTVHDRATFFKALMIRAVAAGYARRPAVSAASAGGEQHHVVSIRRRRHGAPDRPACTTCR